MQDIWFISTRQGFNTSLRFNEHHRLYQKHVMLFIGDEKVSSALKAVLVVQCVFVLSGVIISFDGR